MPKSPQPEVSIALPISVIWAIEEALMNPTAWGKDKAIMLVQYLQKERGAIRTRERRMKKSKSPSDNE